MLPGRGDKCSRYPSEQHENVPECTRLDPFTSQQRACVGRWDSITIAMGCIEALIALQRRLPSRGLPGQKTFGASVGAPFRPNGRPSRGQTRVVPIHGYRGPGIMGMGRIQGDANHQWERRSAANL